MEVLKKKPIAMLIMSLIIFVALVLTAKAPIGEAVIILLILLVVFSVIDLIVDTKFLAEKQAKFVSAVVGLIAVAGIVIWGAFAAPGAPVNSGENVGQGNTPPSATVDEAFELGLFYFEKGDYEEAIQTLKEVADGSSSYVEAQKLLVEATDCYRNGLMNTANTHVEKDDYKLAIDILNVGLLVIPDDAKLLQKIDDYSSAHIDVVRTAAIADAEAYVAEQDYTNAIRTIWRAQDEVGNDVELDALEEKYLEEYKNFALVQADKLFISEGYEVAIQFLQEVQSLPLLDSELSKAVENYQSYQPVSVAELEIWREDPLSGKCGPNNNSIVDNYGNSYSPYFDYDGSNIYKIDKKYSTLTGVFCVKKEENSSSWITYLYIWKITNGERDSLLYSSQLTGGNEPVEFSINVSDVDFIEICLSTGYHGANAFVANLFLTK